MKIVLVVTILMLLARGCGNCVSGTERTDRPGPSTGNTFIMDGDGCPGRYTYVREGAVYGGCTFTTNTQVLKVDCGDTSTVEVTRYESRPVWRSDSEPSSRGLQVFWPGGAFACVKER
jgi:hypothetical protein